MKLIVILAVVAVLLIGGGGAVYFFRDGLFGAEDGGQTAAKMPITNAKDALFVDLETLNIAVIHNRQIEKHVLLQVTLEVTDEQARALVAKTLPRIKDAFIKDLYEYYTYQPPGREGVNIEVIKKRLKRSVDAVMRDGSVKKVLIQGAVERKTGTN